MEKIKGIFIVLKKYFEENKEVSTMLTLLLLFFQVVIGYKQTIVSQKQSIISEEQVKLQKDIQEIQIQPFFQIREIVADKNRDIYIYNFGEDCYINSIREISFVSVEYRDNQNQNQKLLIPISFFGIHKKTLENNLIYKIMGVDNNYSIFDLNEVSNNVFDYVERYSYIKINFTNKMNIEKTFYFDSEGKRLNNKKGQDIFTAYSCLSQVYSYLYGTHSFALSQLTIEEIEELLNNTSLIGRTQNYDKMIFD